MKKLLELLNEYRTEKEEIELYEFEVSQTLDSLNYLRLFIKWLVENDKIDYKKANLFYTYYFDETWNNKDYYKAYTEYESLLMQLSIQDNPIEFLCSVLK